MIFESKEHLNEVNKKVMEEMVKTYSDQPSFGMLTDMKKMAYSGFAVAVEA